MTEENEVGAPILNTEMSDQDRDKLATELVVQSRRVRWLAVRGLNELDVHTDANGHEYVLGLMFQWDYLPKELQKSTIR